MKPKIGIMTFYAVQNYGAALQAFALQQSLNALGADAEFLRFYDVHNETRPNSWKRSIVKTILKGPARKELFFHLKRYIRVKKHTIKNSVAFDKFKSQHFTISQKPYYDIDDLKLSDAEYNGFVTGSDMVWTPIGQNLEAYLLQFASDWKRFAYAPSMTGCSTYSEEQSLLIAKNLKSFNSISCREMEGVKYVEEKVGKKADLVCDPTLLLNQKQWIKELGITENKVSKPYILCYMFGGLPKDVRNNVVRISKERNWGIRYIPMNPEQLDYELAHGNPGPCGPKEFVELFVNSSFVITNSYHGFLFAVNCEKPFLVYHREKGNKWKANESRISDLLDTLGIGGRYVETDKPIVDTDLEMDYTVIRYELEKFRSTSKQYLETIVETAAKNETAPWKYSHPHIGYLPAKQCTGCGACEQNCPFNAIKMVEDVEGFFYPRVEEKLCKSCNKCVRQCPSINPILKKYPTDTFLAVSNDQIKEKSASGGVFATIAKYVIENMHGYVYGAVFDKQLQCKHTETNSIEGITAMQNSKYMQSDTSGIYSKVEERLKAGKYVLFSGTPCQVAALKSHLGKEYEGLITMEVICHGVPNQRYWRFYLNQISNGHTEQVSAYTFRTRGNRRIDEGVRVSKYQILNKLHEVNCRKDPFFATYMDNASFRLSCYYCQYACSERVADITIGDCDSRTHYPDFFPKEEKSSLLLNSEKGKKLWGKVETMFDFIPLDYELESSVNTSLTKPTSMPTKRDVIYHDLYTLDWKQFVKKYTIHDSFIKRTLRKGVGVIRKVRHSL